MGMYDTFETNPELESDGIWLDYGDFRVKIASASQGNPAYIRYAEKALKPVRRAMEAGTLSNERSRAIMVDIYAKTIIKDWQCKTDELDENGNPIWRRGIERRDGSIGPFGSEEVKATLTALNNLFVDIQEQANSAANYRRAELEAEAGNS